MNMAKKMFFTQKRRKSNDDNTARSIKKEDLTKLDCDEIKISDGNVSKKAIKRVEKLRLTLHSVNNLSRSELQNLYSQHEGSKVHKRKAHGIFKISFCRSSNY